MAIKPLFSQADIKTRLDNFLRVIENRAVIRLKYLGEMCVKHAREIPASSGFTDQTGNLRSSIGYMVFINGEAAHEGYTGTSAGTQAGKMLAKEVGAKYKEGICLVVTAGMGYAVAVESRGKDVITSAEILAKKELPRMLAELKANINKALYDTDI